MSKKKKYDYFNVTKDSIHKLKNLCPLNTFLKIDQDTLKDLEIVPNALVDKTHSALIVSSGSNDSEAYTMVNLNRVDFRDNAIDQMPFAVVCSGSTPLTSGSLVQHGDWSERTTYPNEGFWDTVTNSGINNYFQISEMPLNDSGNLEDLTIKSQHEAFADSFINLREMLHKPEDEE